MGVFKPPSILPLFCNPEHILGWLGLPRCATPEMVIHLVVYSLCSNKRQFCGWLWGKMRKPDGMGVRK